MKQFKTLVALVLALMMVLSLSTAFATTITINKNTSANTDVDTDSTTYTAYKIFDAEYASNTTTEGGAGDGTVSYKISTNSPWYSIVSGLTDYLTLSDIAGDTTHKTVSLKTGVDNVEATAKAIAAALKGHIDVTGGITTNTTDTVEENGIALTAGTATDVSKGYYLILSSNGVNLVLATTDVTITEKNTYITDDKIVFKNNYNIGDDVVYYITVNLPASIDTTKDVVVHDDLDAVLKFNNDTVVYVSDSAVADPKSVGDTSFVALSSAYTVATTGLSDSCDFHITINPAGLAGKTIVFKYTAKLLDTASADTSIKNKEWSSHADYTTLPSEPEIKTFDIDLKKTFQGVTNAAEAAALTATFTLSDGTNNILFTGNADDGYVKVDGEVNGEGNETITLKGLVTTNVKGLAEGTYTLTETGTSAGYNMLTDSINIVMKDDGTYTATYGGSSILDSTGTAAVITIENNAGAELPSTGGIGTTIFYIAGLVLVLGAAAIVIARRKADQH